MATTQTSSNFNWMALASMFLNKMKKKSSPRRRFAEVETGRQPVPLRTRTPAPAIRPKVVKLRRSATQPQPGHMSVLTQFEALRMQLLRHLVLYQKQLLALKMPMMPEETKQQQSSSLMQKQRKVSRNIHRSSTNKMTHLNNERRKWEKAPDYLTLLKKKSKLKKKTNHSTSNCIKNPITLPVKRNITTILKQEEATTNNLVYSKETTTNKLASCHQGPQPIINIPAQKSCYLPSRSTTTRCIRNVTKIEKLANTKSGLENITENRDFHLNGRKCLQSPRRKDCKLNMKTSNNQKNETVTLLAPSVQNLKFSAHSLK